MIHLGVNIDHVATLRQARRGTQPDILEAARAAERGGADGITVHLREDRRHIQDADVFRLRAELRVKMNLEIAATQEMFERALEVRPADVCLVPERREEITTEGGLDAVGLASVLTPGIARLREAGVRVSLFLDPDLSQVAAARDVGADAIEIHTGAYANASPESLPAELERIGEAARVASEAGLIVHAGHGLTVANVAPIAAMPVLRELNIGHSLVSDAILLGLEESVRRMKVAMVAARAASLHP